MKIVILDGFTANPGDLSWKGLEELGTLTVYDRTRPEETVARAADVDIVLTNKVIINREVMAQLPQLKYIGVLATGYNVVDIEAAHEHDIIVTNVPGPSVDSDEPYGALCPPEPPRSLDQEPRLLLLGLLPYGVGWQDLRHRRIREYRTTRR